MKKALFILALVSFFALPAVTLAHPGNVDKNGGHTCRTNCYKWGLKYGQYHYHRKTR